MARKNITKVLRAWDEGRPAVGDARRSCSTDGMVIYSYRMPIARRCVTGVQVVSYSSGPSATTRSQIRAVLTHVIGHDPEIVRVL